MISEEAEVPPNIEEYELRAPTEEELEELGRDLREEVEDAMAGRQQLEMLYADLLRQYDAKPRNPVRDVPIPNAPNLEVPIGAIASDAIYAQAVDTIFQISPVVTVRPNTGESLEAAKALQRFINWGVNNEWKLREAAAVAFLDDTQLGTGVYYIPWIEKRRKTTLGQKVVGSSPRIMALAVEDFFVPGAAPQSLQDARWLGHRHWFTAAELKYRGKYLKWDIESAQPCGGSRGTVRERRETLAKARLTGEESRTLFEIFEVYISYDYDGDGLNEDMLCIWDRTSGNVLSARPNPFDRARPYESMVYQPRPHLFHGIGVLEMLRPFQEAASEIHNQRILNMLLANCRIWALKPGTYAESIEMWPGRVLHFDDPTRDIQAIQMADVYSSSHQAEAIILQYAERRSGLSDLQTGQAGKLGSRTPGITALSLIQQVNQRFTPAYDAMRDATAAATRQCLYRYQERALMNDPVVEERLVRVLGAEEGQLVLGLLKDPDFDDAFKVELTASSASVNRDADRQNSLQLMQILGTYYEQLLGLVNMAASPATPPEVKTAVVKIIDAAGEAMDRTIRTFDQVRDPSMFVIKLQEIFEQQTEESGPHGDEMAKVLALLAQMSGAAGGQPGGQQGGPPPLASNGLGPVGSPSGALNV